MHPQAVRTAASKQPTNGVTDSMVRKQPYAAPKQEEVDIRAMFDIPPDQLPQRNAH